MTEFIIEHKEIINLLASVGSFISTIIALYTLIEVKKQRLSTYKPEILVKSFLVYINKSPLFLESDELLLFKTDNFNEYKSDKTKSKEYEISCLYKIENLGFGLAKSIKVTWSFDMERALKILDKELDKEFYFTQCKPLKYYFLKQKNNENFQISFMNKNKIIQTTDYITPISVKEHTHYHTIPKDIVTIHFLYYIFKNNLTEKNSKTNYSSEFKNFPQIKMKIEYYDLNNKKYINKYKLKTSIVTTQHEDKIDMSREFGYLLFKIE
ncbi:hypothetical protein PG279_05815 [Riemerella anatipestifer]|nr:hypothetical protein [Riemerella anatipestifer]